VAVAHLFLGRPQRARMKKSHFRTLLILSVLAVISEALISGTRTVIPEAVRTAAEAQVIPHKLLGVVESAFVVLFGLAAYVGLFLLWRPARWLLVVAVIFEIVSLPIIQPWAVYSGWVLCVMHFDLCLQGVILAIAFSSLFPGSARPHTP
jgi:hypothetical protein